MRAVRTGHWDSTEGHAISVDGQTPTEPPGYLRSLWAGAVLGLTGGTVLAVADVPIFTADAKISTVGLFGSIAFPIALLVPVFLVIGGLGGFLLRLLRAISPLLHRGVCRLLSVVCAVTVFAYGVWSGVGFSHDLAAEKETVARQLR